MMKSFGLLLAICLPLVLPVSSRQALASTEFSTLKEYVPNNSKSDGTCEGHFNGPAPSKEELDFFRQYYRLERPDFKAPSNVARTLDCDGSLSHRDLRGSNLAFRDLKKKYIRASDLRGADLWGANLSNAALTASNLEGADLTDANLESAHLAPIVMEVGSQKVDMVRYQLKSKLLPELETRPATLKNALLDGANLRGARLSGVDLSGASMMGAQLQGASFHYVVGVESLPNPTALQSAQGLDQILLGPQALSPFSALRNRLREAGLKAEASDLGASINRGIDAKNENKVERYLRYVLFDVPCDYGASPFKPLLLIVVVMLVFLPIYALAVFKGSGAGIWREGGSSGPGEVQLKAGVLGSIAYGSYFGLVNAFRLGFRDFNVGHWITAFQTSDFVLKPQGWIRTFAGAQSLISIYLFALFVLSYFGSPFE